MPIHIQRDNRVGYLLGLPATRHQHYFRKGLQRSQKSSCIPMRMKTSALGSVYSPLERSKREKRFTPLTQETTRYPKYGRRHLADSATAANAQGRAASRRHQSGSRGKTRQHQLVWLRGIQPPDQMDTETHSPGLGQTGEGYFSLLRTTSSVWRGTRR